MALSDCSHCWNTPCSCGFEFKDKSIEALAFQICEMTQLRTKEQARLILNKALDFIDNPPKPKHEYSSTLKWINE